MHAGTEQSRNRQQRLGVDPQTGVRSRLPRKRAPSGTGRRALDRAVWPLHTPRVFRNTRPVPGYRQETRDRQIAGWKLYTEDKGGDRDDWSSVTALYSANGFSTLFFFSFSWKLELLEINNCLILMGSIRCLDSNQGSREKRIWKSFSFKFWRRDEKFLMEGFNFPRFYFSPFLAILLNSIIQTRKNRSELSFAHFSSRM